MIIATQWKRGNCGVRVPRRAEAQGVSASSTATTQVARSSSCQPAPNQRALQEKPVEIAAAERSGQTTETATKAARAPAESRAVGRSVGRGVAGLSGVRAGVLGMGNLGSGRAGGVPAGGRHLGRRREAPDRTGRQGGPSNGVLRG